MKTVSEKPLPATKLRRDAFVQRATDAAVAALQATAAKATPKKK